MHKNLRHHDNQAACAARGGIAVLPRFATQTAC
jgi:hypothetical protein